MVCQKMDLVFLKRKIYKQPESIGIIDLYNYDELGKNITGVHSSESYLVIMKDSDIIWREVDQADGSKLYFVDQLKNTDSVILWPGGRYDDKHLVCGSVGTVSSSYISHQIMNDFQKCIKKMCRRKVGNFYIGKRVEELRDTRLITDNINQDPQYDLKI